MLSLHNCSLSFIIWCIFKDCVFCAKIIIVLLMLGQQYRFVKAAIPDGQEEKVELCKRLGKYGISLRDYKTQLQKPEIVAG